MLCVAQLTSFALKPPPSSGLDSFAVLCDSTSHESSGKKRRRFGKPLIILNGNAIMSAPQKLSYELWFAVFGELQALGGSLAPVMLVCRSWKVSPACTCKTRGALNGAAKDIAEPLLYRRLRFPCGGLGELDEAGNELPLEEADRSRESKIARWTWTLRVTDPAFWSSDKLLQTIRLASSLREFNATVAIPPEDHTLEKTPPELYEALAEVAGQTLVQLNTWPDIMHPVCFASIGRLVHLRVLTISIGQFCGMSYSANVPPKNWSLISTLVLPLLEIFECDLFPSSDWHQTSVLSYLCQSVFTRLRDLRFYLGKVAIETEHDLFICFLDAHVHLQCIQLQGCMMDTLTLAAILPVIRAPHLSLYYPPSNPEFLRSLLPDVRELALAIDHKEEADLASLFEVLDAIERCAREQPHRLGVRHVIFHAQEDVPGPLEWRMAANGPDDEAWVGKLLAHASRLHAVGITLLDEAGTTSTGEPVKVKQRFFAHNVELADLDRRLCTAQQGGKGYPLCSDHEEYVVSSESALMRCAVSQGYLANSRSPTCC
jgi:hypothetical protein